MRVNKFQREQRSRERKVLGVSRLKASLKAFDRPYEIEIANNLLCEHLKTFLIDLSSAIFQVFGPNFSFRVSLNREMCVNDFRLKVALKK